MFSFVKAEVQPSKISCHSTTQLENIDKLKLKEGLNLVYFNKKIFKVSFKDQLNVNAISVSFFDKTSRDKMNRIVNEERLLGLGVENGIVQGILVSAKLMNILKNSGAQEICIKLAKDRFLLIDYDSSLEESKKYSIMVDKIKELYADYSNKTTPEVNNPLNPQSSSPSQQHSSSMSISTQEESKSSESEKPVRPPSNSDSAISKSDEELYIINIEKGEILVPSSHLESFESNSSLSFLFADLSKYSESQLQSIQEFSTGKRKINVLGVPDEMWELVHETFITAQLQSAKLADKSAQISNTNHKQPDQKPTSGPVNLEKDTTALNRTITKPSNIPVNLKKPESECTLF